ncbi:transcriptional regulator, BlaI/MecI/CopY family [Leptospira fainei serovar Hurstbridge str. BUT 6]|uniref:Transcriptional regulator, BlaI/MecI/CopY family n=1 Tax=Leptospira fainei serovar Hurstbridge str. BUT 6 TaxID=1193011 RepID=S3UZ54_9LEPT|nr:MarR family transcriptional regulator [Leptospira fainei]EPG74493.1 transcriptional regulator, BlaI/MecI/CopY family [Leptospira fainei serovar Hurstbridge str. BUT 6]
MLILEDQLGFNLNRVAVLFRRELIRALKDYHLSPEQWQVLATLWSKGPLTQRQIIDVTLQDAPSTSKMIRRMIQRGYVDLSISEEDRRVTLIKLTKLGESYKKEVPRKLVNHFESLLKNYPQKNREILLFQLKELRKVLNDEMGEQ